MSNTFELNAESRGDIGKAANRRMRRLDGTTPAVVYGAGKEPASITLSQKDISLALENEAVYSHILTLKIDGKSEKVVLKALQRHPYKPVIMHADFLRVDAKAKLTMNVPLHFLNEEVAPGVKDGGVVSHLKTELEIRCLPGNLPEFIEVDIAELAMDSSLHLTDIKLPKGVELASEVDSSHDHPVVSIHKPRAAVEADADEEATDTEEAESTDKAEGEGDKK